MTSERTASLPSKKIAVGDELPRFDLPVTSTLIVAGAIASRDFMPAHHDSDFAKAQGAPDMFMNILTTNGYVSRFVTDWAGPEAMAPATITVEVTSRSKGGSSSPTAISVLRRESARPRVTLPHRWWRGRT